MRPKSHAWNEAEPGLNPAPLIPSPCPQQEIHVLLWSSLRESLQKSFYLKAQCPKHFSSSFKK